jgi:hypothetical protein
MVAGNFKQLRSRNLEAALIEIDDGDMGAGAGETQRNGATDAAAAARHHADAA